MIYGVGCSYRVLPCPFWRLAEAFQGKLLSPYWYSLSQPAGEGGAIAVAVLAWRIFTCRTRESLYSWIPCISYYCLSAGERVVYPAYMTHFFREAVGQPLVV